MKAWLKGGLIGLRTGLIALALYLVGMFIPLLWAIVIAVFSIPMYPLFFLLTKLGISTELIDAMEHPFSFWAFLLLYYAIIGALIGWIIGKLKQKKGGNKMKA